MSAPRPSQRTTAPVKQIHTLRVYAEGLKYIAEEDGVVVAAFDSPYELFRLIADSDRLLRDEEGYRGPSLLGVFKRSSANWEPSDNEGMR